MLRMRFRLRWWLPRSARMLLVVAGLAAAGAGCQQRQLSDPALVRGTDLYVQGALAYQEDDQSRAIAALQSALQENPNLIMARFLLGTIYRQQGEYSAAVEQFKRVVELDPYVASNHYNLGLAYHLLARLQEAVASYLQAIHLKPDDLKSNMNLGLAYTALGQPARGLPYARKAADLDPRSVDALANLAVVYEAMGNHSAAEVAYRRALELDPQRPETAMNLAGCLLAQKRVTDALRLYEELLRQHDSALLRQRYGYALLMAERADDAVTQFQRALEHDPRSFQALNGLGEARLAQYRNSAQLDEPKRLAAVAAWKQSLQFNPDQPRVQELLRIHSRPSDAPGASGASGALGG